MINITGTPNNIVFERARDTCAADNTPENQMDVARQGRICIAEAGGDPLVRGQIAGLGY